MADESFASLSWPIPRSEDLCLATDEVGRDFVVQRSGLLTNGNADPLALKNRGSARTFADITTAEQVLAFAASHGMLGLVRGGSPRGGFATSGQLVCDGTPLSSWFLAEPLNTWIEAASALKWMFELSGAIASGDEHAIDQLARRQRLCAYDGTVITYVSAPSETVQELTDDSLLFPGGRIHELHVHPDEVREAPRWVLASVINSALQSVSPILTAEEGAPLSFRLRPANLWGALVVQMAQSISGGTTFKKCEREGCSEYFAVTPQVARTNKKYCSDACKSGAWRSRTLKESRS